MSEREHDSSFISFLAGVGLGAIVGGALAVLFAPQRGKATQEELKETAGRVKDRVGGLASHIRDTTSGFFQRERRMIERAVEAGREAARQKKEPGLRRGHDHRGDHRQASGAGFKMARNRHQRWGANLLGGVWAD